MALPGGFPTPKAPRQWHIKWHAIALRETVPQCAPCARTQGGALAEPMAERFAQTARYHIGL